MNRGWKEAFSALGAAILVALVVAVLAWLLSGCSGTRVLAEYEHHSSAQDYFDQNTADQAGVVVAVPLRLRETVCESYCPELEVGLHWELTSKPVFGRDPVGTIRLRQPVWVQP